MRPNSSLLSKIQVDFPSITFRASDTFAWLPTDNEVRYTDDEFFFEHLLHELAHAELEHKEYTTDITLLSMEREAWQYAEKTLAPRYHIAITTELIEDDLDTYRDWLHARSTCPHCKANGIQTDTHSYMCIVCQQTWRVNDAIDTQLRRYKKNSAE